MGCVDVALNKLSSESLPDGASGDCCLTAWQTRRWGPSSPPTRNVMQGVWDLCWASDCPDLLAVSERDAVYILRGGRPEEPVPTAARMCAFSALQVTVRLAT